MDVWTANVIGQNNGLFNPEYYTNVTTVEVIDGENVTVNTYIPYPTGMDGPAEAAPRNYIRVYSCCFGDLDDPINSTVFPGEEFTYYCDTDLFAKSVLIYDQDGPSAPDRSGTTDDSSKSASAIDGGVVVVIVVVVVVVALIGIGVGIAYEVRKSRVKEGQLLKNSAFEPHINVSDNSSFSERASVASLATDGRQSSSLFGRATITTTTCARTTESSLSGDDAGISANQSGDGSQIDAL
jgi:hypothetical protein